VSTLASGNKPGSEAFSLLKKGPRPVKSVLESLSCPVVLWTPDRFFCILNDRARRLVGYSEDDFRGDPSLWMDRVHPIDRNRVSSAWKNIQGREKIISCDYRFLPKSDTKEIWLRDVSVAHQDPQREIDFIASTYTDISDLKVHVSESQQEERLANIGDVIGGLVHEMQNNLQVIYLGLDFLGQGQPLSPESQALLNSVERAEKSIHELREYFLPSNTQLSPGNPGMILETVVKRMEKELAHEGVRIRFVRRSSLPLVPLDLSQFRSVVQRVMEFSRALLPQGGEIEIQARERKIGSQRYVELKIAISSVSPLRVEGKDVFRPFLRVNGYQVGLSIELAQQVLRRHEGEISFQKETPRQGQFIILLKAHSD